VVTVDAADEGDTAMVTTTASPQLTALHNPLRNNGPVIDIDPTVIGFE
jgi:hypothetical protein